MPRRNARAAKHAHRTPGAPRPIVPPPSKLPARRLSSKRVDAILPDERTENGG